MFSLQDLLGQDQGTQAVDQISQNVGADSSLVNSAIQLALPALIGGLANNAATPDGAESLNAALDQDHSGGGILDNLGGLAGMIFGRASVPTASADCSADCSAEPRSPYSSSQAEMRCSIWRQICSTAIATVVP